MGNRVHHIFTSKEESGRVRGEHPLACSHQGADYGADVNPEEEPPPAHHGTIGEELEKEGLLLGETRCQALAHFLRERREALAPERVGISSHRGRRTPGLRREEVAFLADIGVKWYARLEAGDEIHPSAATLTGIAIALQLSTAELDYMLSLAGLTQPAPTASAGDEALPESLRAVASELHGAAVAISDRILTPLHWNRLADALYGYSHYSDPVERNTLVRSLYDQDIIDYLGPAREDFVLRAVGMFRLNYSSSTPSPLATDVYEKIKGHPLFQRAWKRRVIASDATSRGIAVRYHPIAGKLETYAVDFSTTLRTDLIVRSLIPATEETARKFAQIEQLGAREHRAPEMSSATYGTGS